MSQKRIIQLVVAWTLTIVFVFTAGATALSLVGLLKFEHEGQQEKLFYVLIVEVIAVSIGFYKGFISFRETEVINVDEKSGNAINDKPEHKKRKESPKSLSEIDKAMQTIETEQKELRARLEHLQDDRIQISQEVANLRNLTQLEYSRSSSPTVVPDISGTWYGQTGEMIIKYSGDKVNGDYDWKNQPKAGHITGTFDGQIIVFRWRWDHTDENGNGFFFYDKDRKMLNGSWFFDHQNITLPDDIENLDDDMMHPWKYTQFQPLK